MADQQQRDVVGLADRGEQVEHLPLDGDVERGGRLVGDDQRGRPISPMAIIARCRMPPENSCGYWRRPRSAASAIRTDSQPLDRAVERLAAAHARGACVATSASWRPIRWVGLNDVIGSWNTIASEVPSSAAQRRGVRPAQVVAEQRQPGRLHRAVVADEAGDRQCGEGLARAGLADDADRLAAADDERDAAHRADRPVGPGKVTSRSRTSSTTSVGGDLGVDLGAALPPLLAGG